MRNEKRSHVKRRKINWCITEVVTRSVRKTKRVIECVKKFGKVLLMRSVSDTTARRRCSFFICVM